MARAALSPKALILSASALLFGSVALLFAGPLDPPAGPVASTYKTLNEVEPRIAVNATNTPGDASFAFRITQPGSYYLTGNVAGVAGKSGIGISASGVTLDLNGFEVVGIPGANHGIVTSAVGLRNITVRNGTVRNWGQNCVDLGSSNPASCCTAADLRVSGATLSGIFVSGDSLVTNCTALSNGANGIIASAGSTISGCTATDNSRGIFLGNEGLITRCTARANQSRGIETGSTSNVVDCVAGTNVQDGILLGVGSKARDCIAAGNLGFGIRAAAGRATVVNCTASGNLSHGFVLGSDSTIIDSTASDNSGDGIQADFSTRIRRCSVRGNNPATVANGIHITGSFCFLEGNSVIAAGTGIKVDGGNNKMIRNTCTANTTNWNVATGNSVFVVFGVVSSGFSGNTGGTASGATDPDANFSY